MLPLMTYEPKPKKKLKKAQNQHMQTKICNDCHPGLIQSQLNLSTFGNMFRVESAEPFNGGKTA